MELAREDDTNNHLHTSIGSYTAIREKLPKDNDTNGHKSWWFLSTAFPMIAGTLGPVASAFSICSLAEPWRQDLVPGADNQREVDVPDPSWLVAIEVIQLIIGIIANLFLLLNMARRVRFGLALPVTIVGWYTSSICRIAAGATAAGLFKDKGVSNEDVIWSQSFYYGTFAAILYFVDAALLTLTFWGACTNRYEKNLPLTVSQRSLILQSILLLIYLLLGAYIFSEIESWNYLDGVYWAVVTLFTVGFGDYYPATDLGRGLLIPFSVAGIISLGLVISSVRVLILENGRRCVHTRIERRKRNRVIMKMIAKGEGYTLDPIHEDLEIPHRSSVNRQGREFERRKTEFQLMRRIQARSSTRRRWFAMAISTSLWLSLWFIGACIFQKAEEAQQSWTYFDAIYFCFEAWTTLGYGDLSPKSNLGKSFYVFWSLLALPTMTILISNASDTVVRIIREGTILVGKVTVLPDDRGFVRNSKIIITKLTFGKFFTGSSIGPNNQGTSSKATGQQLPTHTRPLTIPDTQQTQPRADLTSRSQMDFEDIPEGVNLQLLLISEIRDILNHLKDDKSLEYTFEQWAWYLKLIGEEEGDPRTHGSVGQQESDQSGHGLEVKAH